jgi:CheY-like chemotaxis protein
VPTILVVDDSAVDRRLVGGLLRDDGSLEIRYAVDGAEALAAMERELPDLVVTDLMMPEIDGLALVSTVRKKYPAVPTILMTSKGNEEIAVRALQEGAAGYVPKRTLSDDLLETVRTVLSISARRRNYSRLLHCMARIEHAVVLENDLDLINVLVEYLQDGIAEMDLCDATDRMRIGVALREALLNALYHGNLEMGCEARAKGIRAYHKLAEERAKLPPYSERRIFVQTELSREGVVVVVRDEGHGFDPASLPDPTEPANLDKPGGRGLVLMRTFMDEVAYNDLGNAVTLSKAGKGCNVSAGAS